jgi:hypothetical protein
MIIMVMTIRRKNIKNLTNNTKLVAYVSLHLKYQYFLLFILWWDGVDMNLDSLWWNILWSHYLAPTQTQQSHSLKSYNIWEPPLKLKMFLCLSFCDLLFLFLINFFLLTLYFFLVFRKHCWALLVCLQLFDV